MSQTIEQILKNTAEIVANKGTACPDLDAETRFLGGELPFDSLDLATLIVGLEMEWGVDPFREGFREFHTVGELAALYEPLLA